jgi:hypothetical protein
MLFKDVRARRDNFVYPARHARTLRVSIHRNLLRQGFGVSGAAYDAWRTWSWRRLVGAVKNCSGVCVKRRTLLTGAGRGERLYNKP